ncbi:MAG TPA: cytidylate kinase-like family protein [Candidatus Elarobacter sp.]|nr:cytidylate kinase-like family protein [Candidatus Elarobacter sp.]
MIVSISRELGAGGRTVGEAVAGALGAALLDERSIIEQLAKRSGLPREHVAERLERPPNAGERLIADLAAATAMLPIPTFAYQGDDALVEVVRELVLDEARRGDVVVIGHGGVSMLGWRPAGTAVFAMLLRAGRTWRIAQLARRYGIDADEARRRIDRTDDARVRFHKHYFDSDMYDCRQYDIVLNAESLGIDAASAIACEVATAFKQRGATPAAVNAR